MTTFTISGHAVEQYRQRVILCCERERPKSLLRAAMQKQIEDLPWRLAGGETFVCEGGPMHPRAKHPGEWVVAHATHTFVIERSVVVTVLSFWMRADRKYNRAKRHRRKVRKAYREKLTRSAAVPT